MPTSLPERQTDRHTGSSANKDRTERNAFTDTNYFFTVLPRLHNTNPTCSDRMVQSAWTLNWTYGVPPDTSRIHYCNCPLPSLVSFLVALLLAPGVETETVLTCPPYILMALATAPPTIIANANTRAVFNSQAFVKRHKYTYMYQERQK
ncbi:hypothetical protein ElyMa_004152600 [Elysia marginata]|uniref:Uncharacterized protein n=1 Tax=Elysia marginata TaxID=1093978 RepID=A0AAV4GHT6_9GAST|nr:hypothetical protein ElyMa_004152600 [Elysia marginata]